MRRRTALTDCLSGERRPSELPQLPDYARVVEVVLAGAEVVVAGADVVVATPAEV